MFAFSIAVSILALVCFTLAIVLYHVGAGVWKYVSTSMHNQPPDSGPNLGINMELMPEGLKHSDCVKWIRSNYVTGIKKPDGTNRPCSISFATKLLAEHRKETAST